MEALVFRDVCDLAVADVPRPRPLPQEVVVDVSLAGICGSDIHGYVGHSERRTNNTPLIMGHEIVGRVSATGSAVTNHFAIGERVVVQPMIACGTCATCRAGHTNVCPNMEILGIERSGGFASSVAVPADRLFAVPDSLPDEAAVMVEPLAIEVRLFRQLAGSLVRSVVILGAGAQGILAIQLARMMGISRIIASDTVQARLDMAMRLGATNAIHALEEDVPAVIRRLTGGEGVEVAIETAGASAARQDGLHALSRGGTFAIVGLGQQHTPIDFLDLVSQEKRIQGVYCYTDDDFVRALEILTEGHIQVEPMISTLPLSDGPAAFTSIAEGMASTVKTLLRPTPPQVGEEK